MASTDLFVPDRFDALSQQVQPSDLPGMIEPIESALQHVRSIEADMRAAGRGSFLIFRGESGAGKSTFLHTLPLFFADTEVLAIARQAERPFDGFAKTSKKLRVVILEGREALGEVRPESLEAAVHDVNSFLRSPAGRNTVVVWPVNTDEIEQLLVRTARKVGAEALLGVGEPSFRFSGPGKDRYIEIANKTIALLNQGAGIYDLGVSTDRAIELAEEAATMGRFMGLLRRDLIKNVNAVDSLVRKEKCRLWVLVAASNEPEGDVDGLTRGVSSSADVPRLMAATGANIVEELKQYPEKLGILGTVLDLRIFHLPALCALACARDSHDARLEAEMKARGLATTPPKDSGDRIRQSSIGRALEGKSMGARTRGSKMGSNSEAAFLKLVKIAESKDELLNAALGTTLRSAGLIQSFKTEQDFGTGLSRATDILCEHQSGPIRLEVMWRAKTGRADIANYTLTKLYNYGRAIGILAK